MSYRYEQYEPRQRRGAGRCVIVGLIVLVWVVLGGLLLVRFVARPLLTGAIQRRAQQLPQVSQLPSLPNGDAAQAIPAGPISIDEGAANAWVQEHRSELQGIDNAVIHFVPGQVTADLTVSGFTATAQSGVAVRDGRVIAVNPQLGPPLNLAIDVKPIVELLEQRLNTDLASLNRRVTDVQIEQGQMTITLE